jgi:hypothetical protein
VYVWVHLQVHALMWDLSDPMIFEMDKVLLSSFQISYSPTVAIVVSFGLFEVDLLN